MMIMDPLNDMLLIALSDIPCSPANAIKIDMTSATDRSVHMHAIATVDLWRTCSRQQPTCQFWPLIGRSAIAILTASHL